MSESTIVLITGANSGVGYATAQTIASQPNYHVIMACRDLSRGEQARQKLLDTIDPVGTLSVLQLDVEDDASISQAVETVSQQFGRVDAFISNAGITAHGYEGREKLQKIFSTNVLGAFMVTEAFIPLLLQSRSPRLIHISTALGSLNLASDLQHVFSVERFDEYRMSKAALNMLTIQQHKRLKGQNVRVFAFCPGLVRSNLRGCSEDRISANGRAGDPIEAGKGIMSIVVGQRDEDAGKFLHKDGVFPW